LWDRLLGPRLRVQESEALEGVLVPTGLGLDDAPKRPDSKCLPGAVKGECHAASIRVGISAMTPTLPDQLELVVFERTPKTPAGSERSWPQSIGTLG
jgi:hypothetical protein